MSPEEVVAALRATFESDATRPLAWRLEQLDQCGKLLRENAAAISAAQEADHVKPSDITGAVRMTEGALMFYKASLPSWVAAQAPDETLPPPMRSPGSWSVVSVPKGVGLVIAPWNAPVLLCLLPLMGMVAAGNCCVLKPSELAPKSSALIAELVPKYFPGKAVAVCEGGPETVQALIAAKCDHIVFTGGGSVAAKILALAAPLLTPVSLELGGKNPCFVDGGAQDLEAYAAEIIGTKRYFGGMFCQCHDYCLVTERSFDAFVELCKKYIGAPVAIRMINERHAKRVKELLEGQQPVPQAPAAPDEVPLCLVLEPKVDSPLMRDEIFGPVLPIIKVKDAAAALAFARARPAPLVCYCYSPNEADWALFETVQCGNLAVNCGPMRMQSNMNVGFGGMGASGHGYSIWGKAAFDDYSHKRPCFKADGFSGSIWAPKLPAGGQGYPT